MFVGGFVFGKILFAFASCAGSQKRDPVEIVQVDRDCLEAAGLHAPPEMPAITFGCPGGICTEEITVCTDFAGALRLEEWTRRITKWAAKAEAACRAPSPDSPPKGGADDKEEEN